MAKLYLTQQILNKFYYCREFLKKSKKYARINDFLIDKSKRYPITNPLVNSWCYAKRELKAPYFDWLTFATSADERESLYQEDKSYKTILNVTYPLFRDVNDEEQFGMLGHRVKLFYETYQFSPINSTAYEFLDIIDSTFREYDDEKLFTKKELIEELHDAITYMACSGEMNHLIRVNPLLPAPYLIDQFKQYLKSSKCRDTDILQGIRTMFLSSNGHREDLLDDLLKLLARLEAKGNCWDQKNQKLLLKEVYFEDNTNLTEIPCNDSNWSLLRRHKNLAFELIEKAENATFPGPCTAPKEEKGVITTNELSKIGHLLRVNHRRKFSDNNVEFSINAECWPFCT